MAKKKKKRNKGLNQFQNWGTLAAIAISVLALFVSIYQTNLMADQQRATVWPYLYIARNYKADVFQLELFNNGTGPAIIESVEFSVDGQPVADYVELFDAVVPSHQVRFDSVSISRVSEQVIRAGFSKIMIEIGWNDEMRKVIDQIDKVDIKIHYCSVLEECWTYDFRTNERTKGQFSAREEFEN